MIHEGQMFNSCGYEVMSNYVSENDQTCPHNLTYNSCTSQAMFWYHKKAHRTSYLLALKLFLLSEVCKSNGYLNIYQNWSGPTLKRQPAYVSTPTIVRFLPSMY